MSTGWTQAWPACAVGASESARAGWLSRSFRPRDPRLVLARDRATRASFGPPTADIEVVSNRALGASLTYGAMPSLGLRAPAGDGDRRGRLRIGIAAGLCSPVGRW